MMRLMYAKRRRPICLKFLSADVSGVDTDPFAKPSQNESIEALGTDSTGELGGKLTQDAFNHVESLTSSQMGKF